MSMSYYVWEKSPCIGLTFTVIYLSMLAPYGGQAYLNKLGGIKMTQLEAYKFLKELDKDKNGKVYIYANITHVSRSGMMRYIKFYARQNNNTRLLTIHKHIADLLNHNCDRDKGIKVGGCGMDMVFSVLSNLNYKMATMDTNKTINKLLEDPKKPCGVRIYDDYFTDAENYQLL